MMKKVCLLLLALSLVFGATACANRKFDYLTTDMLTYVRMEQTDFTGKSFSLSGDYVTITDEYALHQLDAKRLLNATFREEDVDTYTGTPDWGDEAYIYYHLSKEPQGDAVASNISGDIQPVYIGFWDFPESWDKQTPSMYYLKALSDALQTTRPVGRVFDRPVATGDILRVWYEARTEDGTLVTSHGRMRSDASGAGLSFLKEGDDLIGVMPGESRSFTVTEKVGEEEKPVTYTVTVAYIAEEQFATVALELPEDCFNENYAEHLQSLNGQTVYFQYILEYYTDMQIPSLRDETFLKRYISGFSYDPASGTDMKDVAVEAYKKQLQTEQNWSVGEEMLNILLAEWLKENRVKKLPDTELESYLEDVKKTETESFESDREKAGTTEYPYDSVDSYIREKTGGQYNTLERYARATARDYISYRLFVFAAAQVAGIRLSEEEAQDAYDTNLRYYMQYYGCTEDEFLIRAGGKEAFRNWVNIGFQQKQLSLYLAENNSWDKAAE